MPPLFIFRMEVSMGSANIPDDWMGEYRDYVIKWPLSEQWEAILRGQLTSPKSEEFWDVYSGNPLQSQDAMDETFDTNLHLKEGTAVNTGMMMDYAGSTIPDGWLICDGSEVSRTTYARLFAVIGTIYGAGDGSTTFELPQARGRVNVALDITDADFNALGEFRGQKTVTLETSEIPSHTHTQNPHTHVQNAHNHGHIYAEGGSLVSHGAPFTTNGDIIGTGFVQLSTATNQDTTATNQVTGGGNPHTNLQPSIVFYRLIKT